MVAYEVTVSKVADTSRKQRVTAISNTQVVSPYGKAVSTSAMYSRKDEPLKEVPSLICHWDTCSIFLSTSQTFPTANLNMNHEEARCLKKTLENKHFFTYKIFSPSAK